MDTIKGLAIIVTFIGVFTLRHLGVAVEECVARVGRACSWCNLRHPTQSPWLFALPPLVLDAVAGGGLSLDIGPANAFLAVTCPR